MTKLEIDFYEASWKALRQRGFVVWGVSAALVVLVIAVLGIYADSQRQIAAEQAAGRATAEYLARKEADAGQTAAAEVVQRSTAEAIAVTKEAEAQEQRQEAERQSGISLARQLAAQADNQRQIDLPLSLLLGIEAVNTANTFETRNSLLTHVTQSSRLERNEEAATPAKIERQKVKQIDRSSPSKHSG